MDSFLVYSGNIFSDLWEWRHCLSYPYYNRKQFKTPNPKCPFFSKWRPRVAMTERCRATRFTFHYLALCSIILQNTKWTLEIRYSFALYCLLKVAAYTFLGETFRLFDQVGENRDCVHNLSRDRNPYSWGPWGLKTRIVPRYPQARRECDWKGVVSRNNREKGWPRFGASTGTLENPTVCVWCWEPAHLSAVSYITEISLPMTIKLVWKETSTKMYTPF